MIGQVPVIGQVPGTGGVPGDWAGAWHRGSAGGVEMLGDRPIPISAEEQFARS